MPGRRGYTEDSLPLEAECPPQSPRLRTRSPEAHEQRRPGGRGRRRAAGAMSQRQVVQGRARGGRPDGWRRELGTAGRPLHRVSLPAVFEQYQKARTQFVQMVAELATRPQNIETLQNAGEPSPRTRVASHTRHRVTWCLRLALHFESLVAPGPRPCRAPHRYPCRLIAQRPGPPLHALLTPLPFPRLRFSVC